MTQKPIVQSVIATAGPDEDEDYAASLGLHL